MADKSQKKAKKRAAEEEAEGEPEAKKPREDEGEGAEEEAARMRVPIAYPFSDDHQNLTKKLLSLVKNATQNSTMVRGIREVTRVVRKDKAGESPLVLLAADISPIDCIAHMPVLLEDKDVPFVWVPSRHDLGAAAQSKRPTSAILITGVTDEKADTLRKAKKIIQKLQDNQEM
eukprot:TRINITY_DN1221_c1_g1_i1.p2 TRINITY_DN1221_c1_g1~~TRINITY_DN1221_c1_g1_i1.p2  ORF type:complete len:174 (+),score=53.53 TRINITY_DN1221_c1_g1_i1:73-594(+)